MLKFLKYLEDASYRNASPPSAQGGTKSATPNREDGTACT
jgi:hypothetical protein